MAEFVETLVEKTIDNLDQLRHVGLISEKEAKDIIKTRQSHEYRLNRRMKRKEDFLRYIQYEINLLEMIRLRRKKSKNFKRFKLNFDLLQKVHNLFRTATTYYSNDVDLWLSQIAFAKNHNQIGKISYLYKKLLQIHPHKPELWLQAIGFEIELKDFDTARKTFLTAIRFNQTDRSIWTAYQRFELQQCVLAQKSAEEEKNREKTEIENTEAEKQEEFPEAVLDGRLSVLAFKKAIEAIPGDDSFAIQLFDTWVEIANSEMAKTNLEDIFELLPVNEGHAEIVAAWCRKALVGYIPGYEIEAIHLCLEVFAEKSSESESYSKCSQFQTHYGQFIVDVISKVAPKGSEEISSERKSLLTKIRDILSNSLKNNLRLGEGFLAEAINLLMADEIEISQDIIQSAIEKYPTSKRLWLSLFELLISKDCKSEYLTCVERALSLKFPGTTLGQADALAVWNAALQICIFRKLPREKFDQVLQKAAQLHLSELGPCYIDWAYHSCDLEKSPWKAAERAFTNISGLTVKRPLPFSLHLTRLRLAIATYESCLFLFLEEESIIPELNIAGVRNIFSDALIDAGPSSVDMWLMMAQFEFEYGDLKSLTHLSWQARRSLTSDALTQFNDANSKIIAAPSWTKFQHSAVSRKRKDR